MNVPALIMHDSSLPYSEGNKTVTSFYSVLMTFFEMQTFSASCLLCFADTTKAVQMKLLMLKIQ